MFQGEEKKVGMEGGNELFWKVRERGESYQEKGSCVGFYQWIRNINYSKKGFSCWSSAD